MVQDSHLQKILAYFNQKLETYGPVPQGVDWNSEASQTIRFEQLLKVCDLSQEFSLLDYGCGYGGMIDYLLHKGCNFYYVGYDPLESMIDTAKRLHAHRDFCTFYTNPVELKPVDYTISSGIFNIKLEINNQDWTQYALEIIHRFDALSKVGFSFNMLTSYSDPPFMRPDLYYGDPLFMFDYCKKHFSRNVALLHDYNLYDFTIIVRKQ
jgi:SAM-dependent methyltransferase